MRHRDRTEHVLKYAKDTVEAVGQCRKIRRRDRTVQVVQDGNDTVEAAGQCQRIRRNGNTAQNGMVEAVAQRNGYSQNVGTVQMVGRQLNQVKRCIRVDKVGEILSERWDSTEGNVRAVEQRKRNSQRSSTVDIPEVKSIKVKGHSRAKG